jgi:hypothetical protein
MDIYDIIGERVKLVASDGEKIGFFMGNTPSQLSFGQVSFGGSVPDGFVAGVDFVWPVYSTEELQGNLRWQVFPGTGKDPRNPALVQYKGVITELLEYSGRHDDSHIFRGQLECSLIPSTNDRDTGFNELYLPLPIRSGFEAYLVD